MNINKWIFLLILLFISPVSSVLAQEGSNLPDETPPTGKMTVFLDNRLLFGLSATNGGFGFGGTVNGQYVFPFHLGVGLESGYYSFRASIDQEGARTVGGFSLIPLYATVSFNIPVVSNFYITPILKVGGAYAQAKINGWLGGDSFAPLFEGGVRFKAYMRGGLLIQGGIFYTGMIETSGLFSIMSIGMGFGL